MDNENKTKEISNRKLKVVIGLFLSLFSVILFINVTAVPRVFTFGFAFLFGIGSYLIYILLYCVGMYLIFFNKPLKFKVSVFGVIAAIILLIATNILITHIAVATSTVGTIKNVTFTSNGIDSIEFADAYGKAFFNPEVLGEGKNYLTAESINFFSSKYSVGCGIFGYLLLASGNALFRNPSGGLVLAIILFVIAAMLFALPIVLRIIKEKKGIAPTKEKKVAVSSEEEEYIRPNYNANTPKETIKVEYKPDGYEANANNDVTDDSMFEEQGFSEGISNGMFVKPIFSIGDEENDNTPKPISSEKIFIEPEQQNINAPVNENPIQDTDFFEEVAPMIDPTPAPAAPAPAPVANPVREEKPVVREQISLDFDAKPQLDESLVGAKPEFIEPVAVNRAAMQPQPQPVVQPVVKEKPEEKRRPRVKWIAPSSDFLDVIESGEKAEKNIEVAENRMLAINEVFNNFKIGAQVKNYVVGPSVTRFNVAYQSNVSSRQVSNITEDIAIRLNGVNVRFVPVVEGQSYSGLEIPNAAIATVSFKEVFEKLPDVKKHPLAVAFGKNIQGDVIWADFDEFPHLLVAGTTGSGKSIFVNSLIATLIMRNSPDDLKIVLVDPKTVEMTRYKDMPHLLRPIIYTAQDTLRMAKKLQEEMERRYKLFSESNGATNIKEYNEDCDAMGKSEERLPVIIFILDEYADLIDQCKELSLPVVSLAQKARACGIHLFISTQRPSTNVVTGTIKANLPTHVALSCANTTDSITIIGEGGAEKLLGKGDMLVQSPLVSRVGCVRLQGCYASRGEIIRVVEDLKKRYETYYDPFFLNLEEEATEAGNEMANSPDFQGLKEGGEEEKYQTIKEWVMSQEFMSISRIQRECQVGFNRAGRFFIRMQNEGIVDTQVEGNKGCRVLVQNKFGDETDNQVVSDEQSYFRE